MDAGGLDGITHLESGALDVKRCSYFDKYFGTTLFGGGGGGYGNNVW